MVRVFMGVYPQFNVLFPVDKTGPGSVSSV